MTTLRRQKPGWRPARRAAAGLVALALAALGCAGERPDATASICGGPVHPWDTDGDGISDLVEIHGANGGHGFEVCGDGAVGGDARPACCDQDPSRPVGSPVAGELTGGVNLPDLGTGYRHVRGLQAADARDWSTLAVIGCLEAVGRVWERTGFPYQIEDLSLQTGGPISPHRDHRNGVDVDVRFVRSDGGQRPVDIRREPASHSPQLTRELMNLFLEECEVAAILADCNAVRALRGDLLRPELLVVPFRRAEAHGESCGTFQVRIQVPPVS